MGRRIKDVKDRIQSILGNATQLNLVHNLTDDHTRIPAEAYRKKLSLLVNETQTVGMEEKIEMIMNWLNDPQTRLIAVLMKRLPKEIRELHCLKHLDASIAYEHIYMPTWISKLTSLETLRGFIFLEGKSDLRIEDLKGLIQLRELQLKIANDIEVGSRIEGLVKMQTLYLRSTIFLPLLEKIASLKELGHLKLFGFSVVSNCVPTFQNLFVLTLESCFCTDYLLEYCVITAAALSN
eukprot:Gb_32259 [translate_table: standard]